MIATPRRFVSCLLALLCVCFFGALAPVQGAVTGQGRAWGYNGLGQLGTGGASSPVPEPVAGTGGAGALGGIAALAAGDSHSLALLSDGSVRAWGNNQNGELGDNTGGDGTAAHNTNVPVTVNGVGGAGSLAGIVAIAAGQFHSLALTANGTVLAWGSNLYGQLGDGTTTDRPAPVMVTLPGPAVAIAAGGAHSLALMANGTVYAWGFDGDGELGDGGSGFGAFVPFPTPVLGPGGQGVLTNIVGLAGASSHSLALTASGSVYAWGYNNDGELGTGAAGGISPTPVAVVGLSGVVAIAAHSESFHSLALTTSGAVYAWGNNFDGELGNGTSGDFNATPAAVPGLTGVVRIATGATHSLALLSDSSVQAWGDDTDGRLGDGNTSGLSAVPVPVEGVGGTGVLTRVAGIAGGGAHSLAFQNLAPVANPDAFRANAVRVTSPAPGVLANDFDPENDPLTATVVTSPSHGTLTLNPDGGFVYMPTPGYGGTDTFTYQAQDAFGPGAPTTVTISVDNTAPTTAPALAAASYYNGFFRGPVMVTLTATDPDGASDVAQTFYRVDSGPQQTYTGPFAVEGDFQHLVTFFSTDRVGNAEGPAKSVTFSIDTTAPVTTITSRATAQGREVTLTARDNFSGPGGTFYRVDSGPQQTYTGPFTVTGNFQHLVTAYSLDRAGNAEAPAKSLTFGVDTSGPTTTAALAGPSFVNGFYRGPVTVTLNAMDKGSSIAGTFYRVDSGPQQTYMGPFTVSGEFQHLVTFYSVDSVGFAESPAKSVTFSIDTTAPVTTITSRATAQGREVTLTARDNFSGPGGTFYRVDSGPQQTYSGPFTVTGDFQHLVTFFSIDNAGNAEAPAKSLMFTVDSTSPITAASLSGTPVGGAFRGPVTVTLRATDNGSGVAGTFYRVDSGPQQTYAGPFLVSGAFQHTVTFFSADRDGNAEGPAKSISFTIVN